MDAPKRDDETLARQLDDLLAGVDQSDKSAAERDPLLATAQRLARVPQPGLSPEAAARIRARVIHAQRQQARVGSGMQRTGRSVIYPRFGALMRWAAAAAVILIIGLGGLLPVSASSLPGDALYPVKMGFERVELVLALSDSARAKAHLRQAERRVNEGVALLERNRFDENLVSAALSSMEHSGELARRAELSASEVEALMARTITVTGRLNGMLQQAARSGVVPQERAIALSQQLLEAHHDGHLLLPPPPMATATPVSTEILHSTATLTVEPSLTRTTTATLTASVTATESLTPTLTLTTTPSPTLMATATMTLMPTQASESSYTAYVIATQRVNVRSGPGLEFSIITALNPGDVVIVIAMDDSGAWSQVRLPANRTGWIYTQFLSEEPPVNTSFPPDVGLTPPAISTPPMPVMPNPDPDPDPDPAPQDCTLPGAACDAPGQGNMPPGQGGLPPGLQLTPPGQS